jgi:hypothetical protein
MNGSIRSSSVDHYFDYCSQNLFKLADCERRDNSILGGNVHQLLDKQTPLSP